MVGQLKELVSFHEVSKVSQTVILEITITKRLTSCDYWNISFSTDMSDVCCELCYEV